MTLRNAPQTQRRWQDPAVFLATGFGVGRIPRAPGTFGSLVGVALFLLGAQHLSPVSYGMLVTVLFLAGIWICDRAERALGRHDAPAIVWDEIVGQLIALFAAPTGWIWIAIAFGLFRLFDIWKPFPVGWLNDRIPGGFGVMLDDLLAGLYALVSVQALAWLTMRI